MDKRLTRGFWGILLIAGGVVALAQTQGYLTDLSANVWAVIFGIIAAAALIVYLAGGTQNWPMLFPVGVFGSLGLMIFLGSDQPDNPAIAAPLFVGIGVPFVVAYAIDRANNWWALIPAGIMAFFTVLMLVIDRVADEWIGTALFLVMGVIFLLVYLNRKKSWALLVAYIMLILSFLPLLDTAPQDELAGIVLFFGIGAPFLYLYLKKPERWWPIIPAGIMLSLAVMTAVMLLTGVRQADLDTGIANAILVAGFAVTFAVLGLRHQKRWGMVLAVIFAVVAVSSLFVDNTNLVGPLALIAVGVFVLFNGLLKKGTEA